jgi:F-type H+-transporting ATPase subunit b
MIFLLEASYLDVISVNFWQMLISVANLLILFLILKRFLFRPVQRVMAARRAQVDQIYSDAADAQSEAEQARAEYTERLSRADSEAEEILRAATAKANAKSEEIVGEAKQEVQLLRRRAEEEIAQEKKKAQNELKNDIASISMEIAEAALGREIREEDHRAIVDRFIGELEEDENV